MKRATVASIAILTILIASYFAANINQDNILKIPSSQKEFGHRCFGLSDGSLDFQPISFTENRGQWDESVHFRAGAGDATMWFTSDGVYYQFTRRISSSSDQQTSASAPPDVFEYLMVKASFVGANAAPTISGKEQMGFKSNYFLGNDPAAWRTGVPNYRSILLEEIYEGIDLKYYSNGKQIEYDFVLSPGADPGQVKVRYDGVQSINTNDGGELVVETAWGTVTELLPFAYQLDDGVPIPIEAEYVLFPDNTFGFGLGDSYDPTLALVIDPAIAYSTYLGGSSSDQAWGIEVDDLGNAYIVGTTGSADFPLEGEYQTHQGIADVFVTKLNTSGDGLVYSTYIGGASNEEGWDIDIDEFGNAYITGQTISSDYPTVGQYQTFQGVVDVIVTKLNATGDGLVYSTYLGGGGVDYGRAIMVGNDDQAFITGSTESTNFPLQGQYQTDQPGTDAFVTRFNTAGNGLQYSTYLGGDGIDRGSDIDGDPDSASIAYITGYTSSTDFPTQLEYQTHQGGIDVFVTRLSPGGSIYNSTYLGGSSDDGNSVAWDNSIAVDNSEEVYVTGYTISTDFPTVGPYQTDQPLGDVFVSKFNYDCSALIYSTYIGGDGNDAGTGIAVSLGGEVYITGETGSTDFPTSDEYHTYQGNYDVFMLQLHSSGSALKYSTYLGGASDDIATDLALDDAENVYVTGYTESSDFPVQDEYQNQQGGRDCFVAKFDDRICGDVNSDFTLQIDDVVYTVNYLWNGGPEPIVYSTGDIDGIPGISCHDAFHMNHFIFHLGPLPYCAPFRDTILPASTDIVEFRNTTVPAGETQWDVDVWLTMNDGQVLALSLPFFFTCPTSSIICDEIDFTGSIFDELDYANKFAVIDTAGQKAAIGIPRFAGAAPDADSGLLATLTFTVNSSGDDQVIIFDTTSYAVGDGRDYNTVMVSKATGANSYAYTPRFLVIGAQPTIVFNLNNAGYGSLRYAMNFADTSAADDTITFTVSGVIELQTALPAIDGLGQVHILGATAPGGYHSVILDGSNVPVGPGFAIVGSSGNVISGLTIRDFPGVGIVVDGPTAYYNSFASNLIHDNGGLGIDLGNDGVTENDSLDLDTGPNHLLNYPDIDSIIMNPDSSFTVHGNAYTGFMANYSVGFYIAQRGNDPTHTEDPSGHGEAYEFIGAASTSGLFNAFEFTVPNTVPFFSVLTTTLTYVQGGGRAQAETSEFGENFVLAPAPLVVYGYSPINLMVIDPAGDHFGKYGDETFLQEITPADYYEEPDIDSVVIHHPIAGTYHIEVYGTTDAQPGDTYTMGTRINGSTQVVLIVEEDVPLLGEPPDDYEYEVEEDWHYENGDANRSGGVDIDDVVFMIAYIFTGGPIPDPPGAGDANCSLALDIDDVVYLIAFIFSGGPPPCDFER